MWAPPSSRSRVRIFDGSLASIVNPREGEDEPGYCCSPPARGLRVVENTSQRDLPVAAFASKPTSTIALDQQGYHQPQQVSDTTLSPSGLTKSDMSGQMEASQRPAPSPPVTVSGEAALLSGESLHLKDSSQAGCLAATGQTWEYTRPSPSRPTSFGYITEQGQYRCALCQSQLPSEEDLGLHQVYSKEHLRNLGNEPRISMAKQQLAQLQSVLTSQLDLTAVPPSQPLRGDGNGRERSHVRRASEPCHGQEPREVISIDPDVEKHQEPSDTTEVTKQEYLRALRAASQQRLEPVVAAATLVLDVEQVQEKKRNDHVRSAPPLIPARRPRASSEASDLIVRPATPPTRADANANVDANTNTNASGPSPNSVPTQEQERETPRSTKGNPSINTSQVIDQFNFDELIRSTEITMQVMEFVRREALSANQDLHSPSLAADTPTVSAAMQTRDTGRLGSHRAVSTPAFHVPATSATPSRVAGTGTVAGTSQAAKRAPATTMTTTGRKIGRPGQPQHEPKQENMQRNVKRARTMARSEREVMVID